MQRTPKNVLHYGMGEIANDMIVAPRKKIL